MTEFVSAECVSMHLHFVSVYIIQNTNLVYCTEMSVSSVTLFMLTKENIFCDLADLKLYIC
jgi:hypothetical protein